MKTRKIILIHVLFVITSIIFAQSPDSHKGHHHAPPPIPSKEQITNMIDKLAKEITLTEEQKKTVLDLHLQHFKQVKESMCADNPPDREKMEALKIEFEKAVKAILSKEQQKDYDTFMKNLREQRPKR